MNNYIRVLIPNSGKRPSQLDPELKVSLNVLFHSENKGQNKMKANRFFLKMYFND